MNSTTKKFAPLPECLTILLFLREESLVVHDLSSQTASDREIIGSLSKGRDLLGTLIDHPAFAIPSSTDNQHAIDLFTPSILLETSYDIIDEPHSTALFGPYTQTALRKINQLDRIISELKRTGQLTTEQFAQYIQVLESSNSQLFETSLDGFRLYLAGEHLAASYILTFSLEGLCRQLLSNYGHRLMEQTRNGREYIPLGRAIKLLAADLPASLAYHLEWTLKDYQGLNLRNSIAHGLLMRSHCRPFVPAALVFLYLHLLPCFQPKQNDCP